jgi:hypothetical protein
VQHNIFFTHQAEASGFDPAVNDNDSTMLNNSPVANQSMQEFDQAQNDDPINQTGHFGPGGDLEIPKDESTIPWADDGRKLPSPTMNDVQPMQEPEQE